MKFFLPLILISIFFACSSETEEQIVSDSNLTNSELLDEFQGQYYLAHINESKGEIVFREDCWTKKITQLELSEYAGSPGNYFIAVHGHHSSMQIIDTIVSEKDKSISLRAYSEDDENPTKYHYSIFNRSDGYIQFTEVGGGDYLLVPEEKLNDFSVIPCQEKTETLSDLDYINKIFMVFFALKEGGETLLAFIPEDGVQLLLPGSGVSPIESTVHTPQEISTSELFKTPAYDRLMEYVQMHNNEERAFLEFVEELPDRCMPEKEALFVKTTSLGENPIVGTAMLTKMNDELEEVYTYVIIHVEYTDRMRITKIDAMECGL